MELRQATDSDRGFFWEVHRAAMRPPVEAMWGWDERFQERYFNERYRTSGQSVVVIDGADVGILCVALREDHLFLSNVALLPRYQGKGLGTQLVKIVLEQGRRLGLPVKLQVLKTNRARGLYERLGFTGCGETQTHFLMTWQAAEKPDPAHCASRRRPA